MSPCPPMSRSTMRGARVTAKCSDASARCRSSFAMKTSALRRSLRLPRCRSTRSSASNTPPSRLRSGNVSRRRAHSKEVSITRVRPSPSTCTARSRVGRDPEPIASSPCWCRSTRISKSGFRALRALCAGGRSPGSSAIRRRASSALNTNMAFSSSATMWKDPSRNTRPLAALTPSVRTNCVAIMGRDSIDQGASARSRAMPATDYRVSFRPFWFKCVTSDRHPS